MADCEGCPGKKGNRCEVFGFENAVIACPDFTLIYYIDEYRDERLKLLMKVLEYRGLTDKNGSVKW